MNKFFKDNMNISKVNACVYVPRSAGQMIHTNRPNHGIVILLDGQKDYTFSNGELMHVKKGRFFICLNFPRMR